MEDSSPPVVSRETLAPPLVDPSAAYAPAQAGRLTFVVESEGGKPASRTVVHEGDVFRIGTHASNDLVLDDRLVSRFHCRIVPDGAGWRLEDSGSLNGTRIGDLRILGVMLPGEAVLTLGESVVRVYASDAAVNSTPASAGGFGAMIGTGRAMRKLFATIQKVAASDINCLIHGESGTGKELVASEIVRRGARTSKPFVVVDCGAISPSLVESELFGHVRGAFTGADRDRVGAFEAAEGGTVFLDEIGELPLGMQPKLLRALEQRQIRRVGETRTRKIDVRVIAATNRDLEREVNRGSFREDLYFRLAVITLRVPPLRDRLDDVPHLVRAFLAHLGAEHHEARLFPPEVMSKLSKQEWPGNVRELRNHVERSVVLQSSQVPTVPPPPVSVVTGSAPQEVDVRIPYKTAKDVLVAGFERSYVRAVLVAADGNVAKAAKIAGIDRMYMHRLIQKHGLRDEPAPAHDATAEDAVAARDDR